MSTSNANAMTSGRTRAQALFSALWFMGVAFAGGMPLTCSAQIAVVVSAKSPVSALTPEQVANLFTGRTGNLPSGSAAVLADLPEASATHEQFYTKATGKSAAQIKAVWSRLMFTGKGSPPKEFPSAAELKKFVASSPDAIGYIDKASADATVKIVCTFE